MSAAPASRAPHHSRVFGAPWPGVHGTHIDSARSFGRHWHETFGLGLIEHGAQRSASGRGQVDALAGDLITTNPGEVHDGRPLGGPSRGWRMVYLEPDTLAAFAGSTTPPAGLALTRPVLNDAVLRAALAGLFVRLGRWGAGEAPALACEEAMTAVCARLLSCHAAASTPLALRPVPSQALRDARERLADEALAPPTLAELAAPSGISRYQLLRRFEQAWGLPPHAWLLQQRAERARRLIRDGSALAEAASACGFADQSHLTRVFTRRFGFTPGAWARATTR